ncbi:hypothetical protein A3I40_02875 [Candidatus Uhrbacteria bacterium RIFCSPLOWO2_02_FULL_48_12]|uniref:Uncharacterized protein n=1 Tax=Candidatus Uhrbacteria bacterium RIFCSPLOWO2_02_FULL_48_12 TaxID=1802407 RepID=A0A1F7V9D8_9BACT|nr:MAG: hypothetical protein A3I40_02875 [Candidatus Uhrbacteria bacterium RIFCSPLOWO2_02_FULL_48_12]
MTLGNLVRTAIAIFVIAAAAVAYGEIHELLRNLGMREVDTFRVMLVWMTIAFIVAYKLFQIFDPGTDTAKEA